MYSAKDCLQIQCVALNFLVATPLYLLNNPRRVRAIDVSGVQYGYIVSHSYYGETLTPYYPSGIDRKVILRNLDTQEVQINIEYMDMEGLETGSCYDGDHLEVKGVMKDICGLRPNRFTVKLSSNEIYFRFTTNWFKEGRGFWLRYNGE